MPRPRIQKPQPEKTISQLHRRSKHSERYNMVGLSKSNPRLAPHLIDSDQGDQTINFFDPEAVKELNRSLLMHYYGVEYWDVPEGYLIPPIPSRADYIHFAADLMSGNYPKRTTDPIPLGAQIKCLDVGVGANCVYPIIGNKDYGWSFVGSDIDTRALTAAQKILDENGLTHAIELRKQDNESMMFDGFIQPSEFFDLSVCNPPFHASADEAEQATRRKLKNLTGPDDNSPVHNFGGTDTELWCEGGELNFIAQYIKQSKAFGSQVLWFTTLVSKKDNVGKALRLLEKLEAFNVQVIEMSQGSKVNRLIGWSFKNRKGRKAWHRTRWEVS